MARPSKYTPDVVEAICAALSLGLPRVRACALANVSRDSFDRWLHRYADFAALVAQKEAEFIGHNVNVIQQAADEGTWQGAAWLLERRWPMEFGKHDTIRIQAEVFDETRRLAREAGIDEELAVVEAKKIMGL